MSRDAEIGTLIVVLLKARNLNDKHSFRKQDVFAKASLNGTEKNGKVDIKGGQHPVWDDEVRFPVMRAAGGKYRNLEVSCWSKEPRDDSLLGKGTVDITDIIQTGEFDEWVPLSIDDTTRGDVYLEITYYAHGPPPPSASPNNSTIGLAVPQATGLGRRPSKLVASERLSRPTLNTTPRPQHHGNNYGNVPLSPQGPSTGFPNRHTPAPQTPQTPVGYQPPPSFLRPGTSPPGAPRPYSDPAIPASPTHQNPYLAPVSNNSQYNQPTSTPAPQPNPYLTSSPPPQSNPYLTSSTPTPAPTIYHQQPSHTPVIYHPSTPVPVSYTPVPHSHTPAPAPSTTPVNAPSGPPPIWSAPPTEGLPPSPFSFPVPTVSVHETTSPYPPPWASNGPARPPPPPHRTSSPYDPRYNQRRASDPRDDPALYSRYQTPLPLPPGATQQQQQSAPSRPSTYQRYTPPTQSPPPPPRPAPAPAPSPPRPARRPSPGGPDPMRLMELQRVESEATRRREQEQRDLELAMQLDKELNL